MPDATGAPCRFGYWTDPLCIWAFVAQEKLERILSEFGRCVEVEYRSVPVFGSISWRFRKGPWAEAGVAGRVEATRRIARDHGFENVDGSVWEKDPPATSWTACAAVKAVFAAEQRGEAPAGAAARYQWRLRQRFFVDNVNVARRGEQLALVGELGISPEGVARALDDGSALAAVWEDHQEQEALRVPGSPCFVFEGGRAKLYGDFPFGVLRATVAELVRGARPGSSEC